VESGKIADVRIALGSVAPTVLRTVATERLLQGAQLSPALLIAAQESLAREIAPIDDMRSTLAYRRRVARNLLAEFLEKLAA
jgi:CO/xanthine dehydrogenase FAD-binding subunit